MDGKMKTINVNNMIENFLSGTAGVAEKAWLTKEMKRDPALARELNLRRRTDEILTGRDILDLRAKLGSVEMKKRTASALRRSAAKAAKYAAAIAIVALISSVLYFVFRPASTTDELYTSYYSGYESPGAVRSAVSSGNTLMDNALALYGAREYEEAIGYLEQIIAIDQGNMEPVFMHGVANMEVSNFPVAEGSFSKVIDHNDNLYLEDAAWYLGLCYMMTDEREKALNQFSAIAESKSRHSRQAAKLLRKLK
jgi:tetratricopeptide (TPR) repeat protein